MTTPVKPDEGKVIATNRKAGFNYYLVETFEAGLALLGTEVKSIREGHVTLTESFCRPDRGELYLSGMHIGPYSHRGSADHDPTRRRKLLLHRHEIDKLIGKSIEKGMTIVPVRMYFKNGRVKLAIALAKGKNTIDKRETERRREADRETREAIKRRAQGRGQRA